jgi:hypothetical protein
VSAVRGRERPVVLVADDDPDILELVAFRLERPAMPIDCDDPRLAADWMDWISYERRGAISSHANATSKSLDARAWCRKTTLHDRVCSALDGLTRPDDRG